MTTGRNAVAPARSRANERDGRKLPVPRLRSPKRALASGNVPKTKRRDAVATRAKILAAAMEEFAARGLPEARIEDVAMRAGANRRMIYYYFKSKEGLYLLLMEDSCARFESTTSTNTVEGSTATEISTASRLLDELTRNGSLNAWAR